MAFPDEAEMSEVKIEIDVAEDPGLLWSTQDQSPVEMERPNLFEALNAASSTGFETELLDEAVRTMEEDPSGGYPDPPSGEDETSDEEGELPPVDGDSPDVSEEEAEEEEEEAASSETAKDGTQWQSVPTKKPTCKTPSKNIFKTPPTQLLGCQNMHSTLAAFMLFITTTIMGQIIKFTNIEGKRVHKEKWVLMDDIECQALIGLLIFLGSRKQSMLATETIWDSVYGLGIVRACMSRKRFQTLMTFLRFDDTSSRSSRRQKDRFAPFRDVWDEFNKTLTRHYIPGPLLTIDEQLVPFRGRCSFLQYLPSKPDRYGIKVFWVADSDNNFPLFGDPYLGRRDGQNRQVNLGRDTAIRLSTPFFTSGRNVTCDNYFTDLILAEVLLSNGLTFVGTVRANKRFLPSSFKTGKHLDLHSSDFAYKEDATVVRYQSKHKKSVIVLSTMHDTGIVDPIEKPQKKPEMVLFYNSTKGAVDTLDKMAHAYSVKRKTQRWPMVMFFNIIDLATIAARCVWSIKFPDDPLSKKDKRTAFLQSVSEQLMYNQIKRRLAEVVMSRSLRQTAEKATQQLELQHGTMSQSRSASKKAKVQEDAAKSKSGSGGKKAGQAGKRSASSEGTSTSHAPLKRSRCLFCNWRLDRKTQYRCQKCDEYICFDHMHKFCPECFKGIIHEKEKA